MHKDLVYVGCFEGHLFVFDLNTFEKKEYKKLQQGIYDILVFTEDGEDYLLFGQHFGHVDMLRADNLKKVLQTKSLKMNTIFYMSKTSRKQEVAFCGYNGMYFGKIKREANKAHSFELLMSLTEVYFQDKQVQRLLEYTADKFIVCLNDDE